MNVQAALKAMWRTVYTCGFLSTSSLKKQHRIGSCACLARLSAQELLQQLPQAISASLLADAPPRVHRGRLCGVWCDGRAKFLLLTCLGYWKAEEVSEVFLIGPSLYLLTWKNSSKSKLCVCVFRGVWCSQWAECTTGACGSLVGAPCCPSQPSPPGAARCPVLLHAACPALPESGKQAGAAGHLPPEVKIHIP